MKTRLGGVPPSPADDALDRERASRDAELSAELAALRERVRKRVDDALARERELASVGVRPGDPLAVGLEELRRAQRDEPVLGPVVTIRALAARPGWTRSVCSTCAAVVDVLARHLEERPGAQVLCYPCWQRRPPRVQESVDRSQRAALYAREALAALWPASVAHRTETDAEVERALGRAFADGWAARAEWSPRGKR